MQPFQQLGAVGEVARDDERSGLSCRAFLFQPFLECRMEPSRRKALAELVERLRGPQLVDDLVQCSWKLGLPECPAFAIWPHVAGEEPEGKPGACILSFAGGKFIEVVIAGDQAIIDGDPGRGDMPRLDLADDGQQQAGLVGGRPSPAVSDPEPRQADKRLFHVDLPGFRWAWCHVITRRRRSRRRYRVEAPAWLRRWSGIVWWLRSEEHTS